MFNVLEYDVCSINKIQRQFLYCKQIYLNVL